MIIEEPQLHLVGDSFSPSAAERETGLVFTSKNEVGDLGKRGRYANLPIPYGAAILEPPDDVPTSQRLDWLLDHVLPHLETLRRLGGLNGRLHSIFWFDSNCNLEWNSDQLKKLALLGIPYTSSCIQAPEMFEDQQGV